MPLPNFCGSHKRQQSGEEDDKMLKILMGNLYIDSEIR